MIKVNIFFHSLRELASEVIFNVILEGGLPQDARRLAENQPTPEEIEVSILRAIFKVQLMRLITLIRLIALITD